MIYPQTNVAERRRRITKLLVRGFTPTEIAEGIGVSRETVYNDIRYIRSGRNEDLAEYGRRQMLAQVMINARERVRELWSVVEKSESPYVKLLALRELRIHDQQVLNHIFLFTQATDEETKGNNPEPFVSSASLSSTSHNAQDETPAFDDLSTSRQGTADPSKLVKMRPKSNNGKGFELQMEKRIYTEPLSDNASRSAMVRTRRISGDTTNDSA